MNSKLVIQIVILLAVTMACIVGALHNKSSAVSSSLTKDQKIEALTAENTSLKAQLEEANARIKADETRGHWEKCIYKGARRFVWVEDNNSAEQPEPVPKSAEQPKETPQSPNQQPPSYNGSCSGGRCNNQTFWPSRNRKKNRW